MRGRGKDRLPRDVHGMEGYQRCDLWEGRLHPTAFKLSGWLEIYKQYAGLLYFHCCVNAFGIRETLPNIWEERGRCTGGKKRVGLCGDEMEAVKEAYWGEMKAVERSMWGGVGDGVEAGMVEWGKGWIGLVSVSFLLILN